jgi:hypothetical protein
MARDSTDEGFRVTDRRGRPEPEGAPVPEAPPPAGDQPGRAPAATGAASASAGAAPDLTGLFLMFATSALIAMGEAPDPVTGRVERNLAQASEAIDLLIMLRTKTAGNRTPDEDQVLDQLLYDLQMRFVDAKKAARS